MPVSLTAEESDAVKSLRRGGVMSREQVNLLLGLIDRAAGGVDEAWVKHICRGKRISRRRMDVLREIARLRIDRGVYPSLSEVARRLKMTKQGLMSHVKPLRASGAIIHERHGVWRLPAEDRFI